LHGTPISVFEDVIFNPIEVRTLAEYIHVLGVSNVTGICHIASDQPMSKAEFAERLVREAGFEERASITRTRLSEHAMGAPRPLNTSLLSSWRIGDLVSAPSLELSIRQLAAEFKRGGHARAVWADSTPTEAENLPK
jgi:dTDP-4-dehydrorhamnose reductase